MKILFFQLGLLADGSTAALINHLVFLKSKGCIPILLIAFENDKCNTLKELGIEYYVIPYRLSSYAKYGTRTKRIFLAPVAYIYTVLVNMLSIPRIVRVIEKIKPDIIHTNVGSLHVGFLASKICNIPHVWHLREMQGTRYSTAKPIFSLSYTKWLIRKSYTICVSGSVANLFGLLGHENSRVIYDGVFHKNQKPIIKMEGKSDQFLFVGRIEPSKGVEELLEAFIEVKKTYTTYKLIYIGRCDEDIYIKKLKNKAEEAGISKDVFFVGIRKDVPDFMKSAKCTVVSSKSEGFGFVTAEAMHNGCLVIGYNVEGTKEQMDNIEKEAPKSVFRYNSKNELVTQMKTIASLEEKEYFTRAYDAQTIVENLYNIENYSNNIYKFYNTIYEDDKRLHCNP